MNSNRMHRGGSVRGAVRCWGRMGGFLPALLAVGLLMSGCEEDSHESASDSAGVATVEGTWIADEVTTGALTRDLDDLGYSAGVVIGADGRFSIEVVLRDGTVAAKG